MSPPPNHRRNGAHHNLPVERLVLTVIVPAYNERATVEELLDRVLREPTQKEVLVVDDGSIDGTTEIVTRWCRQFARTPLPEHVRRLVLMRHRVNRGKGAAIRTALEQARGELVIVQDADLELDPEVYGTMVAIIHAGRADIVIGTRVSERPEPWFSPYRWGTRFLSILIRLWFGQNLVDEACGFKLLRTADLRRMNLRCQRFEFCPEVVAKASRMGLRFAEVPVRYHPRSTSAGKKLRLIDGAPAVAALWRYRHWRHAEQTAGVESVPIRPADFYTILEV